VSYYNNNIFIIKQSKSFLGENVSYYNFYFKISLSSPLFHDYENNSYGLICNLKY